MSGLNLPSETNLKLKSNTIANKNQKLPLKIKNVERIKVKKALSLDTFSLIFRSETGQILTINRFLLMQI